MYTKYNKPNQNIFFSSLFYPFPNYFPRSTFIYSPYQIGPHLSSDFNLIAPIFSFLIHLRRSSRGHLSQRYGVVHPLSPGICRPSALTSPTSNCWVDFDEKYWWWSWVGYWGLYVALIIFQTYRDFEAGDTQSLKLKWRDPGSNPRPLAPQAKSLTTPPPPLPLKYSRSPTIVAVHASTLKWKGHGLVLISSFFHSFI